MKLNFKNISIDVTLLIIYGVGKFYLGLFFLLVSLDDFWTCGNSYLETYNNIQRTFFLLIFIFSVEFALVFAVNQLRTTIFKYGIILLTLTTLFPLILIGYETSQRSKYYESFDQNKWMETDEKPLTMIRSLVYNDELIGKSKISIINKLGPSQNTRSKDSTQVYYETDGYESPLVLTFENDTLISFTLECHD